MNTSQFMDKQILGLAASASPSSSLAGGGGAELLDLMGPDPQDEGQDRPIRRHHSTNGSAAADVLPSYDFQPIRTSTAAPPSWGSLESGSRAPTAASSTYNLKSAGILENHALKNVSHEDDRSNFGQVTVADIDRTMKKYSDNLFHALEGVSSRLLQLERRTHHLENSVDEFNLTIGNYNGSTDGKLRQLENMLREVQVGVQIMRDKQEIVETLVNLAKLQAPKTETHSSENSGVGQADSRQQSVAPQQAAVQPQHQVTTPSQPQAFPALPAPNAPPPPPMLQNQPPAQFVGHSPHSQMPSVPPVASVTSVPALPNDPYYMPSAQQTEAIHQQYQSPPVPQPQAPPAPPQQYQAPPVPQPQAPRAPPQQYQAPPVPQPQAPPAPPQQYQPPSHFPQYSQPPQSANVNPSGPLALPAPQQTEYVPPHSYPPNVRPPSAYMPPPSEPAPPFYGQNPGMYEPPASRPNSGTPPSYGSTGYGPQGGSGFSDSYGYTGSPSHRGNAGMKPTPFAPSGPTSGGGGNSYGSRLPTAQILPQAAPVSSSPTGSSGNNRVAIDDVVEKVSTMGFSREQVRATVRRLTENGQNVDLNVVLDKLMNDSDVQPQKGWYGR
ncbi:hypothetical protein BRADI_2g04297v3 [Brachypodium distachyon]|uniref:DUF1421 domain-containing protein n=1 Tax=Brachypodium distachyon TaxID=15368 RepID=A0A0Q3FU10_BRADI|nr:hypothetical protein BRADI_2g04297v3 [Brachypodium distachyon]